MRRSSRKRRAHEPGAVDDGTDAFAFGPLMADWGVWQRVKGLSEVTARDRDQQLRHFVSWCHERGLTRPNQITKPILERYARTLYYYRNPKTGKPLAFASQAVRLAAVKAFFRWLCRENRLLFNPASELELPRVTKKLPRFVLTVAEVEAVFDQVDVETPLGVRDRAILEMLYSTGMRRMELVRLRVYDLDVGRATVTIRRGKGDRERVVPVGERALDWLDKYVTEVRPSLVMEPDDGTLFLTNAGEYLARDYLSILVGTYVERAGLEKQGACHLFRHTMATLMLEHGADVRFVQEMLGHAKLETTQIYTHVSIRALAAIHRATHPSARRGRQRHEEDVEGVEAAGVVFVAPGATQATTEATTATAGELLASLAVEDEADDADAGGELDGGTR